jgi:DNA polymerase III alpha subunit
MKTDHLGQMIFSEDDCVNMLMRGQSIHVNGMLVDATVDLETAALMLEHAPTFVQYNEMAMQAVTVEEFDHRNQSQWLMPDEYKNLDIAEYILSLCKSESELQRVGEELLLYQARDLFDLLRYLKFLVDVMQENHLIWGVGRGSSVSSYVLYLLKVHRIDSLHYNLDIAEFLR